MTHCILADADVRSHWAHLPSSCYLTLSPEETSLYNNFLVEKKKEYRNKEEGGAEMLQVLESDAHSTGGLRLRRGTVPLVTHFAALLVRSLLMPVPRP